MSDINAAATAAGTGEKPARNLPGKMRTLIGNWAPGIGESGVIKTFEVLSEVDGVADKDIKAAIAKLPVLLNFKLLLR